MRDLRHTTNLIYAAIEDGVLTWEIVGKECLAYMSEADVADMAQDAGWFLDEDDEEYDNEQG